MTSMVTTLQKTLPIFSLYKLNATQMHAGLGLGKYSYGHDTQVCSLGTPRTPKRKQTQRMDQSEMKHIRNTQTNQQTKKQTNKTKHDTTKQTVKQKIKQTNKQTKQNTTKQTNSQTKKTNKTKHNKTNKQSNKLTN